MLRVVIFCVVNMGTPSGVPINHYHVILFTEKRYNRYELFDIIETAWSVQNSVASSERTLIGSTNCKSFKWQDAQYVGKYTTKEINKDYGDVQPPFHLQSRKPALGHSYFMKHKDEIKKNRLFSITDVRGFLHPIPRTFLEKIYDYRTLQKHSLEMQTLNEGRERLLKTVYEGVYGVNSYRAGKYYFNLQKNARKIKYSEFRQNRADWLASCSDV